MFSVCVKEMSFLKEKSLRKTFHKFNLQAASHPVMKEAILEVAEWAPSSSAHFAQTKQKKSQKKEASLSEWLASTTSWLVLF